MAGVKLLGMKVSPFALRARMALNLKGVSYEYQEEDLFHKSELLLASNPVHGGKVPVLIHDGKPVCESLVVVQYIDEVWSGAAGASPFLPAEPYARATARFWAAYIDDKLFPAWKAVMKAPTEDARAENLREAHAVVQRLEEAFGGGGKTFFGGDSVGYVDLALGCFLPWFDAVRKMVGAEIIDAGKFPQLAAWAERFSAVPEVSAVMPDADKAVAHAKKLQAYYASVANK